MLPAMDDLRSLLARPADLPPTVAAVSLLWAFVIGSTWGSFLNVVIARVPEGLSVVTPRSRCPKCKTQIAARDNIPVLSWILLRGRCRACGVAISPRYPLVEAIMGVAAMAAVARFGWSVPSLELYVFVFILVAIAFVDLDTWTVPHPLWIALLSSGLVIGGGRAILTDSYRDLIDRLIGAAGAGLGLGCIVVVFTGIFRRTGKLDGDQMAMGWGDPLIFAGIGAFLGWRMLPLVLFLGSLQGAVVGLILRSRGHLEGDKPVSETDDWIPPRGAVPFGPFLALGALEAAFFGDAVLARVLPWFGLGID